MKRGRIISVLGVAAVSLGMLAMTGGMGGYRVNLTSSAAIGLWRVEAMDRPGAVGDVVFICPPATGLFKDAFDRGYLRQGLCPGGLAPLLKTIVAVSGQHVRIWEGVIIDGVLLAGSRIHQQDGHGRAIASFAGGIVPAGHLFLHSSMAASYDSRYFGPIPATGLLGRARPVITFLP